MAPAARRLQQGGEEDLEEVYRQRSLLKLSVYPEDIAEASISSPPTCRQKSTGNILNVDAGNASGVHALSVLSRRAYQMSYRILRRADRRGPTRKALGRARGGSMARSATEAGAARRRHRADHRRLSRTFGVAVPTWGVGTGGTRFRAVSRAGRAARRIREARGLRDDPTAYTRLTPTCLAAFSVGQRSTTYRRTRTGARRRALGLRLRRRQLQHVLRISGGAARYSYKFGSLAHADRACARRQSPTISNASRSGASWAPKR